MQWRVTSSVFARELEDIASRGLACVCSLMAEFWVMVLEFEGEGRDESEARSDERSADGLDISGETDEAILVAMSALQRCGMNM